MRASNALRSGLRGWCVVMCLLVVATVAGSADAAGFASAAPMSTARSDHSATLLTSGQLLVAGGNGAANAPLSTAERYDPATNTWTAAGSLASARAGHRAVLLPSGKVLAIGGTVGGVTSASAEIYDPATGAWTPAAPMAEARSSFSATVLASGEVLVVGGSSPAGTPLSSAERYDPTTGTWLPATALLLPRHGHAAARLASGKVLVVGGIGAGGPEATAEVYDPVADTWTAVGSLAAGRVDHSATLLPTGKVLVVGGRATDSTGTGETNSAELFDPGTNRWAPAAAMSIARSNHSAALLPSSRVIVIGGLALGEGGTIAAAETYDPVSDTWAAAGTLAESRQAFTATLLPTGQVIVVGGSDTGGVFRESAERYDPTDGGALAGAPPIDVGGDVTISTLLPSGRALVLNDAIMGARVYDPVAGSWSPTGPMTARRALPTLTVLPSGQALVAGGSNLDTAERYDSATNAWTQVASMAVARRGHSAVLLASGEALVVGGFNSTIGDVGSAERYDPAANIWTPTAPMIVPRHYFTATLLASGKVLVAGGFTPTGVTGRAEIYDPVADTWTETAPLAHARNSHVAALLPSGKVLVAGGSDGGRNSVAEAELYDPATGTWSSGGFLAAAADEMSLTLLPSGRVLIAGGYAQTLTSLVFFARTEIYDPASNAWSAGATLAAPRAQHSATLLPDGRVLFAGGLNTAGIVTASELYDGGLAPVLTLRPQLDAASAFLLPTSVLAAAGSGFRPAISASSGGAYDSPTHHPVFQVQRLDNGQMRFIPNDPAVPLGDTTFTGIAGALAGFPAGPVLVRTWVNGVPSGALQSTLAVKPGGTDVPVATGGVLQATVDWNLPYDGGASPSFLVRASNGQTASCAAPCSSLTMPLPRGTYTFTVTPSNIAGSGPESMPSNAVDVVGADVVVTATVVPPLTAYVPYSVAIQVTPTTATSFVPSGSVDVDDGNGAACSVTALTAGAGQCELTSTVTGALTLTARYSGDDNFTPGIGSSPIVVDAPTIDLTPTVLPGGGIGQPYPTTAFGASGGTPPYTYALASGTLPAGLALAPDGVLSGTPTVDGSFVIVVTATDAHAFAGTRAYTVAIAAATLSLAPSTLPPAVAEASYTQNFVASGGTPPYVYALASGAPPAGLTLAPDGTLAGVPLAAGTYAFDVRASDSSGGNGPYAVTQHYALTVAAPTITLAPGGLPAGHVGTAYPTTPLVASGGVAPYAYALVSGALPPGLALAADGTLAGTPTTAGTFAFSVSATDAHSFSGSHDYAIGISAGASAITLTSSSNPSVAGLAVTFTAAVLSGTQAPTAVPTGSVTFSDGSAALAVVPLDGNGVASYLAGDLAIGRHVITASYGGDTNTAPASAALVQQVNPEASGGPPAPVPALGRAALLLFGAVLTAAVWRRRRAG